MKKKTLNTTSWHYELYSLFDRKAKIERLTICTYPWKVLLNLLALLGIIGVVLVMFLAAMEPIVIGLMTWKTGVFIDHFFFKGNDPFVIAMIIYIMIFAYYLCHWIFKGIGWVGHFVQDYYYNWQFDRSNKPKKIPTTKKQTIGFGKIMSESWTAIKDKTCFELVRDTDSNPDDHDL